MDTTGDDGGFGVLLGTRRRSAGLSQQVLAGRAGVSVATIRDLEQGRTRLPRRSLLDALVAVLDLTGAAEAAFRLAATDPPPAAAPAARHAAPDQPVRVQVLGPLQVRRGPEPVPVGRGRRRAVLGRLALSANDAVPVEDLVDLLWETDPPPVPGHAVQTYLSRLRSALQPAGPGRSDVVRRTPGGYQLNLTDEQLDLADFRRRIRQARAAEPAEALDILEAALALWRGDPLQDVPELRDHPLVTAVLEERIAATLRYADLALAAGLPDRCLPQLRVLAAASPLHEPLHARLIAALAAGNLQASALETYTGIRRRLVGELGIEPSAELAEVHRRVLRQQHVPLPVVEEPDAGRAAPPAQLPADIRRFSGRVAALGHLDELLDAHGRSPSVTIAIVSGTGGVGKTALAVHWAHRVQHHFPDGQLYVNLRGFHPIAAPVSPGQALHGFLLALGLDPSRAPASQDAQSALLRTLLADRRMLIVLDNARDAEGVRPLLPGAAGCFVLITSRHGLTGLVAAEDAHPMPLNLLSGVEARDLLAQRLGAGRAAAEPDAVDAIAGRCAGLPLALAIAAARAGSRPGTPLASLAADLHDSRSRLDALSTGDPGTDVRAVLSCSYRTLGPDAARLFRLVGLHPGLDLSAAAAASVAGVPLPEARRLLAELTRAQLMAESAPGRYTSHDLLHAYAADLAEAEDPGPERRAALDRLFDHQLAATVAATQVLFAGDNGRPKDTARDTARDTAQDAGQDAGPSTPAAARAWLDTERANIVALARYGARHGWFSHTTALAAAIHRYLDSGHFTDGLVLHTAEREAARAMGDRVAEAAALDHLGTGYRRSARHAEAAEHYRQSLGICQELGDQAGAARAMAQLGATSWRLGDYQAARDHHQASLDLYRAIGDHLGEAGQLNIFGIGNRQTGNYEQAIEFHTQALTLLRGLGFRLGEADILNSLGACHQRIGDHHRAIDCLQQALTIFQELGHGPGEAGVLNSLGHTFLRLGQPATAVDYHQRALRLYREVGERSFEVEAINGLGTAHLAAGDLESAREAHSTALAMAHRTGDRHEQAVAHDGLGGISHATGATARAVEHWQQALAIYTGLELPDAELVAAKLKEHTA